ncbi:MAG TPA: hypothetical protein VLM11_16285 [Streptosporangiaceae bacterium]|nr:hypothetical protein [Streptosporangiaceae bacterium]
MAVDTEQIAARLPKAKAVPVAIEPFSAVSGESLLKLQGGLYRIGGRGRPVSGVGCWL